MEALAACAVGLLAAGMVAVTVAYSAAMRVEVVREVATKEVEGQKEAH